MPELRKVPEGTPLPGSEIPVSASISTVEDSSSKIDASARGRFRITVVEDDVSAFPDLDTKDESPQVQKIDRDHWVKLNVDGIVTVKLYRVSEGMDHDYFHIVSPLDERVREDIKLYRIIPYYDLNEENHFLWVLSYAPKYSWTKSIAKLFSEPQTWHDENKLNIRAGETGYRVKYLPDPTPITWSKTPTEQLLADALGYGNIITDESHPVYRKMAAGYEYK